VNTALSVNIARRDAAEVEGQLTEKMREILGGISWLGEWSLKSFEGYKDNGFDFHVEISLPDGQEAELWVQCKADPRPSQFPYVLAAREHGRSPTWVLAAPLVAPRMAAACAEYGWSWFDLAGNCFLDVPGLLRLERSGQRPVHKRSLPAVKLGTAFGDRVVRALLDPENVGMRWTQHELSARCEPQASVPLVNKIVQHLRDERYVEYLPSPGSGFRVRDHLGLLAAWREAYRFDRQKQRGYFSLVQGDRLRSALARLGACTGNHAAYAAFSAADFQAPHVRQPKTWLYLRAEDVAMFEALAEAREVDSGANLVVLIPYDNGVFYNGDGGRMGEGRLACTNIVQTYVDLWRCGGRGKEAAEALLEQRLKPEWKARGLKI
jgi:hypothetical protein